MIIGSKLLHHEVLSSTNSEAWRMIKSGEPDEGTVISADFQTEGRGQAGRRWESEKGMNLLFSVILYPQSVPAGEQFLISMTISLGICDFLDRYCRGSEIKWPNDIFLRNRKTAGILIENTLIGEIIETCIAGIGININQENFEHLGPKPVSLRAVTGKNFETTTCLREILSDLDKRYGQLLYGDREELKNDYLSRLWRFREWQTLSYAESVFRGMISDVLISGQIVIEDTNGMSREFSFREFEYLP